MVYYLDPPLHDTTMILHYCDVNLALKAVQHEACVVIDGRNGC